MPHVRGLILSHESRSRGALQLSHSPRSIPRPKAALTSTHVAALFGGLRLLRISGQIVGSVESLGNLLREIDCLEHLVVEGSWRFSLKDDILHTVAAHAPNLKTLCLSKLQWFPFFMPSVRENILVQWNARFRGKRVPSLPLERLCIWKPAKTRVDLATVVILPSPCLDLNQLRYLAIPASSLLRILDDTQFQNLGKKITHLAITHITSLALLRIAAQP
ncbi:hypothetical protein GYMLUDRAFT_72249 [Collybiopsis luxurians FD-317 M1]|uniref:Uncharacterized protein n=1 Tax=Collybiopsis luxurians FD-317 M1 TaxID=944289 RepID=A0A0D0C4H6_9AGAR|nr:hypothetical protein GYMLUDRAFT_72249 [Collybiopsis luxurians FD-317 M1]